MWIRLLARRMRFLSRNRPLQRQIARNMAKHPNILKTIKLGSLLSPSIGPVAGLEISDSHLRFFDVRRGKVLGVGLRLPPGIVQGGRIADKESFARALLGLKTQLKFPPKERLNIIISLPSEIA